MFNKKPLSSSSLSVIIPAFNEENYITGVLDSLTHQTFTDFELLVVDNNCTDQTITIAKSFGATIVIEKNKGLQFARDTGFRAAKGKILVSTDADAQIRDTNWLQKIYDTFSLDKDLVAYGGVYRLYSGPQSARMILQYCMYPVYCIGKLFSGKWMLIGPNFAVRKDAFLKTGGFSKDIPQGEDIDIALKLALIGKVILDPNLVVYSSGRRFQNGLLSGLLSYGPYWILKVIFRIDSSKRLKDIRE